MDGSTLVTIAPWSQLGENLADYDHGLAAAGTPTSATIDVAPQTSPTTGFGEFPSPPGFAAVLWNDCAELFHELKHAQEAVTGTVPARLANNQPDYATKRMKDGNLIIVSELNAVTAENIYRISVGLPPLREYTYEGEWVTLDEEYVHPPTP